MRCSPRADSTPGSRSTSMTSTSKPRRQPFDYARDRPTPMSLVALWHLGGGAASHVGADATAFGRRDAPYLLSFDTAWEDPAETERCIGWSRAAWSDMHHVSDGGLYLNFAGFGEKKDGLRVCRSPSSHPSQIQHGLLKRCLLNVRLPVPLPTRDAEGPAGDDWNQGPRLCHAAIGDAGGSGSSSPGLPAPEERTLDPGFARNPVRDGSAPTRCSYGVGVPCSSVQTRSG